MMQQGAGNLCEKLWAMCSSLQPGRRTGVWKAAAVVHTGYPSEKLREVASETLEAKPCIAIVAYHVQDSSI